MPHKKSRSRYYVLFFYDGKYEYRPAEDINDATEELAYFQKQPGCIALGIYDPQDWRFDWNIPGKDQAEHADKVFEITFPLRQQ